MRTTIKILAAIGIFIAFSCGGEEPKKKAAEEPVKSKALEMAQDVCNCIDSIKIDPEEAKEAYDAALKTCFDDPERDQKLRDAAVENYEFWNAVENTCPESYQLYTEIIK